VFVLNAKAGRFGEFLRAAESGDLPEGSVLIVENLDRMSRQTPRQAFSTFLRVMEAGIGIVTLSSDEIYDKASVDKDPFKLFGCLAEMTRANNESKYKSERVAAAWSRKRAAAREKSLPLTDRIPGWLLCERDAMGRRTFKEDKDKADIVRRIFAETDQGLGRRAIVKGLNRDGKASFLSESAWQPSSVIKIIRARTTIGEYQPYKRDGNGRRMPDGDPIKDYYPAVIDEALWIRANAAVTVRRTNSSGRPSAEVVNLIRGLARCACGKSMLFLNKGKPPKGGRYYVCSAAAREAKCDNRRLWNSRDVERYLLHQVDPARVVAAFEPATERSPPSLKDYELRIAELTAMKKEAMEGWLRHAGTPLALDLEEQAQSLTEQIVELSKKRDEEAAAERSRPHLRTTRSAILTVAALAAKFEGSTPEERTALRTSLLQQMRTAFSEVVFRPHAIVGLVELPEKPKSLKGAFGLPRPIVIRRSEKGERYFLGHVFFSDDPEEMAGFDGGKGIIRPRFA
jgi:DNA invertase Pin-like site-specific DNA recombinase